MRITFVCNPNGVNSNYRAYQPAMALDRRGNEIDYNRPGQPEFPPSALRADVVHIHRFLGAGIQQMVHRLYDAGVAVVWDNDDDVTNVPKSNPNYARFGGANRRNLVKLVTEMVRLVDVVTTPSEQLAAQFRAAGATDVRVIENYLPDAFPGTGAIKHDGVVVAWLAALEHQVDYEQLGLRETFERLLDAHADLRILSIGLGLGLRSERYDRVREVDFQELPRALAGADVGIAPLADIPWNQARSNVKLKEYGAAGLPWLASPVGAYRGLGKAEGGRLVADGDWHAALDRLIVNARERRKLAKRAAKWAKGQTIGKNVALWEAAYRDAIARAQARAGESATPDVRRGRDSNPRQRLNP